MTAARALLRVFHLPPRMALVLAAGFALAAGLRPLLGGGAIALGVGLVLLLVGHGVAVPGSPFLVPSVRRGPRRGRAVALTFDDGPHARFTPPILDTLARHGARATFFVIGRHAAAHPELVRRIAAAGHGLGSHSFTHRRDLLVSGPATLARDVRDGVEALRAITGHAPRLYRQPMGLVNRWVAPALDDLDLVLVAWSVRPRDNRPTPDPAAAAAALAARLRPGDIVVLHDGADRDPDGPVCAARRTYTLALLEPLLAAMDRRGLTSVPVEELLGAPDAASPS